MVPEAPMERTAGGMRPAGEGWFVINARDAEWIHNERFGGGVTFEGNVRFPQYGINIQVLWPGQSNGYYHAEESQEDFLILRGECLLLVEGEERPLKAWDFVHCPPWTNHIFVGAGEGPCVFVGVGGRRDTGDYGLVYPVADVALRHAAGVIEPAEPEHAYDRAPQTIRGPCPEGVLPDA